MMFADQRRSLETARRKFGTAILLDDGKTEAARQFSDVDIRCADDGNGPLRQSKMPKRRPTRAYGDIPEFHLKRFTNSLTRASRSSSGTMSSLFSTSQRGLL